jgi:hypothetical protein
MFAGKPPLFLKAQPGKAPGQPLKGAAGALAKHLYKACSRHLLLRRGLNFANTLKFLVFCKNNAMFV